MNKLQTSCCVSRSKEGDGAGSSIFDDGSQGQVSALQLELAKSKEEHKAHLAKVTRSLSDLSKKLDGAESSWAPWVEVNTLKQEVAEMRSALDHQITDAQQQQERVQVQEASSPQARTLQGEVAKAHVLRRRSLSDVSQSMAEVDAKLKSAEKSWEPWAEVSDAKQQLADAQNVLDQQIGDAKQPPVGADGVQGQNKLLGA